MLYPAGLEHIQANDAAGEDWCVHAIATTSSFVLPQCLHLENLQDPHLISEIEDLTHPAPIIDNLDQAAFDHRVTALLIRLLKSGASQADAAEDAAHAYCRKAVTFIHSHYQQIGQLTDVAEHVGVSYHHLRHCFARIQKQSLSNYVTWVRLERAKAMLSHSQLPLTEIAHATGFANERYFSTCFRKATGSAPGAYRFRMKRAGELPPEALATKNSRSPRTNSRSPRTEFALQFRDGGFSLSLSGDSKHAYYLRRLENGARTRPKPNLETIPKYWERFPAPSLLTCAQQMTLPD